MSSVEQLIEKARIAQQDFENYEQGAVDEVVTAVAWALIEPVRNRELSQMAVETTGLGKIEDKILKNERKTLGLLRDLRGAKSVGVISEDEELGITEIARPVGVVAAVTPSTNPVATPTNNTLNALKGRNAIIIAPSPAGEKVCSRLLQYFHEELRRIGAPVDLIQQLPSPVDKIRTLELMKLADWLIVTGSQSNVRAAYSSGTPAIGVGAGNVTVIVDETADLDGAAFKIMKSKTFDHATSCSSENALVLVDEIYDTFLEKLGDCGGRLLDEQEKQTLQDSLWVNGKLNRQMLARDVEILCQMADLKRNDSTETKFLMVEESGIGPDYPFSGEKLSPVLSVYRASDFDDAQQTALNILNHQGKGHSIGLHSSLEERALKLGLELPVCRVIVNQAHCFATGGGFENGLPFSLSMGCGSWGENSIDDNLNYRHFLNITRIARPIASREVTVEEMFTEYRSRYGL